MLLLEVLRQPLRHHLGLDVGDLGVEGHVQLQALGPGRLGAALQPVLSEQVAQHQADAAALDDGRGRAGIEVEDERARFGEVAAQRQRGVHL